MTPGATPAAAPEAIPPTPTIEPPDIGEARRVGNQAQSLKGVHPQAMADMTIEELLKRYDATPKHDLTVKQLGMLETVFKKVRGGIK